MVYLRRVQQKISSFGGPLGGPVGFGGTALPPSDQITALPPPDQITALPLGVRWVLVVLWGSGGKIALMS